MNLSISDGVSKYTCIRNDTAGYIFLNRPFKIKLRIMATKLFEALFEENFVI